MAMTNLPFTKERFTSILDGMVRNMPKGRRKIDWLAMETALREALGSTAMSPDEKVSVCQDIINVFTGR